MSRLLLSGERWLEARSNNSWIPVSRIALCIHAVEFVSHTVCEVVEEG